MLVVMKREATPEEVAVVVNIIREQGLMPHPLPGGYPHGHRHHRQHRLGLFPATS